MPHSVSPKREPSTEAMDIEIPDAESIPAIESEESQGAEDVDQEMTMADPGVQGEAVADSKVKQEVNLGDLLFSDDDMESDEEFPSSKVEAAKISSSPEAPASPM